MFIQTEDNYIIPEVRKFWLRIVEISREVEEDHQLLEPPQVLLAGAAASPGAALAAAQSLVSV